MSKSSCCSAATARLTFFFSANYCTRNKSKGGTTIFPLQSPGFHTVAFVPYCPLSCTRARLFGSAHEYTSGCLPSAYTCTSVPFSISPVVRAKCTRQMAAQTCNRKPGCVSQSLQKTRSVYPRYGPPSAHRATDASLPVVGTSTRRREGAPRLKWTPETS